MRTRWRERGVVGLDVVVLGGEVTLILMLGEELIFLFQKISTFAAKLQRWNEGREKKRMK